MCAGHWGLAAAFWLAPPAASAAASSSAAAAETSGASTLGLVSLLLFILAWNLSWAGVMLTLTSEVLPQRIRALGTGLVYAIYWLLSFAVSQTLEATFAAVGEASTFAVYGAVTAMAMAFVWARVPETNGIALEALGTQLYQ